MRQITVIPVCLALLACSADDPPKAFDPEVKAKEQQAKDSAADRRAVQAGFAPAAPAPLKTVSVDPPKTNAPGSILPPADRQYRYLGRWAATPGLCASSAWRFETRKLTAASGTQCDLPDVATVPTGYELTGTCRAGDRKSPQTFKLSFDERNRTMTVTGTGSGPAKLIYCGS